MKVRCYIPPEEWGDLCEIKGDQAHHFLRVLRVRPTQKVTCFDGLGNESTGLITRVSKHSLFLKLNASPTRPKEPAGAVSLGIALPRGGKLEEIINQVTQLGVREVIPVATARAVVRLEASQFEKKRKRLSQITVEAAKQSGVNLLPAICPMISWEALLHRFQDYDLILLAAIEGPHENLSKLLLEESPKRVLVLVGPEGDFTPEEISGALQKGARRISLSAHVLRCETAAVVAVGMICFLLGERGSNR